MSSSPQQQWREIIKEKNSNFINDFLILKDRQCCEVEEEAEHPSSGAQVRMFVHKRSIFPIYHRWIFNTTKN